MPTIFTHPVVPLAIAAALGSGVISLRLAGAGAAASILPDADVAAFLVGIPYAHEFGHRGFSHSLLFAAIVGIIGAAGAKTLKSSALAAFLFVFVATASHGILDAFTDGGLGIAMLWPYSSERFFAPAQVIEVSPIGASGFFSARGWSVFKSELLWVWLPCVVFAGFFIATRWTLSKRPQSL
jgi:inner membrane protein